MRGRVLADLAADPGTHLGAVAPVHSAPHTRVAFLGMDIVHANYDVSPDGRHFVMVKDETGSGRLNVVLNWTEELKRLVPTR
jgi:hypothetical protein